MDSRTAPWHFHTVLTGREAQGHCRLDPNQELFSEQAEQVSVNMEITVSLQCSCDDVHTDLTFLSLRSVQINIPKFPE